MTEILPRPTFGEWLRDSLAGRAAGETPLIEGPSTLLERIQFVKGEIVNGEQALRDAIRRGDDDDALSIRESLAYDRGELNELLQGVIES